MKLNEQIRNYEIITTPTELRALALELEKHAITLARVAEQKLRADGVGVCPGNADFYEPRITFRYYPEGAEEIAQLKASYDRLFLPDEDA